MLRISACLPGGGELLHRQVHEDPDLGQGLVEAAPGPG